MMTLSQSAVVHAPRDVVFEHVPNELSVHQAIGAATSIWTICTGSHDGGTELSISIAYDVPTPVLGRLAERVIARRDARNLKVALANVKDVLGAE